MSVSRQCYILLYYTCSVLAAGAISNDGNENINTYSYGNSVSCAFGSKCVSLVECPLLYKVFNHACAYSDRIGNLGCGRPGSGMVCCPITTPNNSIGGNCGIPLIESGTQNQIGSNPWVARVIFKSVVTGQIIFPGAGSIISPRVVLTAAHCVLTKADNYKLFAVRVGEWNTATSDYRHPVQDIVISHAIVHPNYRPQTYEDNIALLVLHNHITYTVTAQPICLPEQWLAFSNYGTLVGWGKISGQYGTSSLQQAVQFPLVGLQQCFNVFGKTMPISTNQLCVGGIPGRDVCDGFGGAPLIQQHNGKHFIIGFLSFGTHQCGAGLPSVYTNVKNYAKWITSNIPKFQN